MNLKSFIHRHCYISEKHFAGSSHEGKALIISQFIDDVPPSFCGPLVSEMTHIWFSKADKAFICFRPRSLFVSRFSSRRDFNALLAAVSSSTPLQTQGEAA